MPQDSLPALAATSSLPEIPVLHVSENFPLETALAVGETRGYALLDRATAGIPPHAIRIGDALSRSWLARTDHPRLAEIDGIARQVKRPGTYFFNVHYEWGCTTAAKPAGSGGNRLVRVLDWRTPGLGTYVVAARVNGVKGPWVTLTWPGYTGVLQAMAKGRFAAAINQAPKRAAHGRVALDWIAARRRVWRSRALTPSHLLRRVFEEAASYAEAKACLTETPVAAPVIYTLAGPAPGEACVIERRELEACVITSSAGAQTSNDWQTEAWHEPRTPGRWSPERLAAMKAVAAAPDFDRPFEWLKPPMLNEESRLAVLADPATGRIAARGYEADGPATAVLDITI
jgi:hypothetical protein